MNTNGEIKIYLRNVDDMLIKNIGPLNSNRFLNNATEEFITAEAAKLPKNMPFHLTVYVPSPETKRADEVIKAIHKHFAWCKNKSREDVKATFHVGRRSLLIGFIFLILIYSLIQLLNFYFSGDNFFSTIQESLTIIAWVALWRPAELLLYEWYPFLRKEKLFHRLEKSEVEVVGTPAH
jgi:hypothetical protein